MKNLASKLLKVQADLAPIERTEDNPFFKSKYFDINNLLTVLKPILIQHGVLVTQMIDSTIAGAPIMVTLIIDADSGEQLRSELLLPVVQDTQKLGGAITFLRRYALVAAFLVIGEADDDGNTATGVQTTQTQPSPVKQATAPTQAGAKCAKCDAPMVHNPKTGKDFCQDKCWLKPQVTTPAVADEEIPF